MAVRKTWGARSEALRVLSLPSSSLRSSLFALRLSVRTEMSGWTLISHKRIFLELVASLLAHSHLLLCVVVVPNVLWVREHPRHHGEALLLALKGPSRRFHLVRHCLADRSTLQLVRQGPHARERRGRERHLYPCLLGNLPRVSSGGQGPLLMECRLHWKG